MAQDFSDTYNKLRVKMFYGTIAIYAIRFVVVFFLNLKNGINDVFFVDTISLLIIIFNLFYLGNNYKKIKPATLILVYTLILNIFITGILSGYGEHGDINVVRDLTTINILVLVTAFMTSQRHTIFLTVFLIASYFIMAYVFKISLFKDFLIFLVIFTCAALFIYSLLAGVVEKTVKMNYYARVEIENLSRFKNNVVRHIFHDLKVPVSSIIDLNKDNKSDSAVKTVFYAQSIKKQLENVLDVERLEQPEMKPDYSRAGIVEIINQAILSAEVLANQKNITIQPMFLSSGFITCDRSLIERVFINLLSNSIKYSPFNTQISVITDNIEDICVITVKDQGIGIKPEHFDKIFEKYFMVDAEGLRSGSSNGLGLTFCRLAVNAHKGSIEVKSDGSSGSEFIVKLPRFETNQFRDSELSVSVRQRKLSYEDIKRIGPLCEKIKDIPIFKISEIIPLIKPLENDGNSEVRLWAQQVSDAVYNGNTVHFEQLVSSILKTTSDD